MSPKKKASQKTEPPPEPPESKVTFYPAWCKRCGNCVAFCPRRALAVDEWNHPYLDKPDRCNACGLCEMLCPDFAISVGDPGPAPSPGETARAAETLDSNERPTPSPERLAPADESEDKNAG
jgi:2-oxoglutarate ferredoxin oxidoreductase subunit delta